MSAYSLLCLVRRCLSCGPKWPDGHEATRAVQRLSTAASACLQVDRVSGVATCDPSKLRSMPTPDVVETDDAR